MRTVSKSLNQQNKIEEQQIKLVDGYFLPSDAADIINAVLDVKINYHKLKRLSLTEGNCNDLCEYDNNRINELIDAKLDAISFFKDARLKGKKLKIKSAITISIED